MSSVQSDIETGVLYTMIGGVPHKLVTETVESDDGVNVTAKYVPAKFTPQPIDRKQP